MCCTYICFLAASLLHILFIYAARMLHIQYTHIACVLHTQKLAQCHMHATYMHMVCNTCAMVMCSIHAVVYVQHTCSCLWGQWPMEYQGVSSFPNIFFSCFIVFLYMSAGCVSTFRSCVQGYLEWLPFVFASHLHFTLC